MELLYLSHCVPNPPDKGERIRAHHVVANLARQHRVHVAAFGRSEADIQAGRELAGLCASVHVEPLSPKWALAQAAVRFAAGGCLSTSFYFSSRMAAYVRGLAARVPLSATVAFSTPMAQYAPGGVPLLLDMTDVDSEKWMQYGRMRWPGALYSLEGRRFRREEDRAARDAECTVLATHAERELLNSFVPGAHTITVENGVDFDFFDANRTAAPADLRNRKYVAFIGVMDYFPNVDAVNWFARNAMDTLRRCDPGLEFLIVGRSPSRRVRELSTLPGVTVTGGVPDVRPYLAGATAIVAPLRLARGIQNKVLEALAMGKPVLASAEICRTFGGNLPAGVVACGSPEEYAAAYLRYRSVDTRPVEGIREGALQRFQWEYQLETLTEALAEIAPARSGTAV